MKTTPQKTTKATAARRQPSTRRKNTITVRIPTTVASAIRAVAKEHGTTPKTLLAEGIYGHSACIRDDPFGFLEWCDNLDASTQETESFNVAFCPTVHAFLSRLSQILRRPLVELASDLATSSGRCYADYFASSLSGGELSDFHGSEVADMVKDAVLFEHAAKRNTAPLDRDGFDCWQAFNIEPA